METGTLINMKKSEYYTYWAVDWCHPRLECFTMFNLNKNMGCGLEFEYVIWVLFT